MPEEVYDRDDPLVHEEGVALLNRVILVAHRAAEASVAGARLRAGA